MQTFIPERAASRYAGQYENSRDVERLFQVLRDSIQIALESGVEETAKSRHDLALECYHQLASMGLPAEIQEKIQGFMESMIERFPTAWRVNAAAAAVERATAARRAETRIERLREARDILAAGIASGEAVDPDELRDLMSQVEARLAEAETQDGDRTPGASVESNVTALVLPEARPIPSAEVSDEELVVETPEGAPEERFHVEVALGVLPRVHLAMLQERRAGVHTLGLQHRGSTELRDLELHVTSDPPFVRPSTLRIERLGPGEDLDLGPRRVASFLSHDRAILSRLSERADGTVTAMLRTADGAELARAEGDWTLFPTDTWFGLGTLPELLAAYVLPNDPAVDATLSLAAQRMSRDTGSPSLDGYQSKDPVRALRIAESVYAALQGAEITYANPPASFENDGQRVRFPSAIISTRLGTCLDLALFAAAALEQAGLHPIVIVTEGHAFVGVWLVEETFSNPVVEEPSRLAKRIELSEIVVFDATAVASRPSPDFEGARAAARERLQDPSEFRVAIDIQRARLGGVRPLPTLEAGVHAAMGGVAQEDAAPTKTTRDLDEELRVYLEAERRRREEEETPDTRLDRWLRQLLDLTMRNRLLNSASSSKRIVPLIPGNLGAIEDRLSEGKVFRVLERPVELEGGKPSAADAERIAPLLAAGVQAGELRCWLGGAELDERLLNLYREARTAREEGGAGALYLAVGFLQYRETKQSSRTRRAPLLLLPLELQRKSARRGYTLVQGADEPRANVTLLEYLRRDHQIDVTGLDPLPADENGVDVPLVLQVFKNAIKDEDGWEILDEAEIGLYSFAKYLLWRDLKNRADVLRRNELVAHLIERPSEPYPDRVAVPDPDKLDEEFGAADVFAPLSYDSSQLSAILAAAAGKTMVLEGPPGTGKSQTITNLIAHAIAYGKTILFVSEKMAALDVVHRRLRHLGLGPACLELHSNKANKKAVLEQFREALEEGRVRGARRRSWEEIAGDLDSSRRRLNGHVAALHATRASGESVHHVIGQTASALATGDAVWDLKDDLGIQDPKAVDAVTLQRWRGLLDEIDIVASEQLVGPEHPLLLVGQSDYSPIFESESRAVVRAFDGPASEFAAAAEAALASVVESEALRAGFHDEESWKDFAALLEAASQEYAGSGAAQDWIAQPDLMHSLESGLALIEEHQNLVAELAARFRVSPTTLPLDALETLRREYVGGGFFKRWQRKRSLLSELRGIAKDPGALQIEDAIRALDAAQRQVEIEPQFAPHDDAGRKVLGTIWRGAETDVAAARAELARARGLGERWAQLSRVAHPSVVFEKALLEGLVAALESVGLRDRAARLVEAVGELSAARAALIEVARPLEGAPLSFSVADVRALQALSVGWADAWTGLRGWARWQGLRRSALDAGVETGGLGGVIERIERGDCVPGQVRQRFDVAFARAWALHEISGDDALKAFDGGDHGRALAGFRQLDDERLAAAREEVRQRTGSRRPTVSQTAAAGAASKTGLGLLQREITKKTRHLAIRRLLAELGDVAMELKPCFLMSPMSVAQYLDADHPPFDIVVFDEASQIPVWDAIGAIARGQQAVIVGDPKQLPPTSFFSRSADTEALEDDDIEDLESILEECIGAQVPTHRLRWHYRSRHESLIAFSNERYYDSKLLTFPSGASDGRGVRLEYHQDAVYDKGATRTNEIEARAVAAEVVRRLRHPKESQRSIGVVTFSQAQQTLVLDLLEAAVRKHPEIEPFFDEAQQEPVFVKNLENVQGDERDVIIFSIGYGPDANGRVSMNFGPLNNDGGERRLNVAITRAREEVLVHTSIRSDQIDLARTNARGVRDLRAFLAFAEHAEAEATGAGVASGETGAAVSRDPLVEVIGGRLQARGWTVEYDIGRSDVRVDLGVRHPDRPGAFLAGIETDGENYRRASTARDRDRLRSDVLGGLGWSLLRVWAVDWWRDADAEVERLHAELTRLQEEVLPEDPEAEEPDVAEPSAPLALEGPDVESGANLPDVPALESPAPEALALKAPAAPELEGPKEDPPRRLASAPTLFEGETEALSLEAPRPLIETYQPAELDGFSERSSEFYDESMEREVASTIARIIELEAPLTHEILVRRMASVWGFGAVSKKFREHVAASLGRSRPFTTEHAAGTDEPQQVYWRSESEAATYAGYRPQDSADARPISEVPQPEVLNAMVATLAERELWPLDDLQREVLGLFGGKRLTQSMRSSIGAALDRLQAEERIRMEVAGGVASVALVQET
ncbi:ATP-dependent RecD-like DNA helicase [Planctomycetes bacterium Poly30]|uniref:ATP-dependent RecD-like DNA helicase n=1 Tax=Saltatorellus ferox TaxID=2528018 RepID=A0A518ELB9_9BACT|nr:ATP-dependent RecD-like DNA helicase [Planctomycetes bacterium Poly30]